MRMDISHEDLPVHTGDFSFDEKLLRALVRIAKPDYDANKPKRWPLITAEFLEKKLGKPYDGTHPLPRFVAYDRQLVRINCVARDAATNTAGSMARSMAKIEEMRDGQMTVTWSEAFYRFPFVFARGGYFKPSDTISHDEYTFWVTDRVSAAKRITGTTSVTPKTTPKTSPKTTPKTEADPKQEPFNEILNMIKSSEHVLDQGPLRQELEQARLELSAERKRVADIEKDKILFQGELILERTRLKELAQSSEVQRGELQKALDQEKEQHITTKAALTSAQEKIKTATAFSDEVKAAYAKAKSAYGKDLKELQDAVTHRTESYRLVTNQLTQAKNELAAKDVVLVAATNEANTLREQMVKIKDEMKKAGFSGGEKRKVGSEANAAQSKKLKTDK